MVYFKYRPLADALGKLYSTSILFWTFCVYFCNL